MKLLLIEDDSKIAHYIQQGFEENGFEVDTTHDGSTGYQWARKNNYQIIITDIIVPGMSGVQFCAELRKADIWTPVLMLTALGNIQEKLKGFDAGADDYLVKPFDFLELLARAKALLNRSATEPIFYGNNTLRFADLEMNLDTRKVMRSGQTIELTGKEFALLEYLLKNKGKVLTKVDIAEKIWNITFDTGTNVIEVYITLLRKKIDRDFIPKLIHTVYGIGYILKSED